MKIMLFRNSLHPTSWELLPLVLIKIRYLTAAMSELGCKQFDRLGMRRRYRLSNTSPRYLSLVGCPARCTKTPKDLNRRAHITKWAYDRERGRSSTCGRGSGVRFSLHTWRNLS